MTGSTSCRTGSRMDGHEPLRGHTPGRAAVPAPLARTLAQRYQTPTWHLHAQRLALDLSTTALETLQQRLGPPALTAMSDTAFVDAMLAAVLRATSTPFPDRVHHRLELQA